MNRFQPIGTRAKAIRKELLPRAHGSLGEFRELLADREIHTSARSVIGKLGINFDFDNQFGGNTDGPGIRDEDRPKLLNRRAELRRAINAVQSSYDKSKPDTITDDIVNTVDYLAAEVNAISTMLDVLDSGEQTYAQVSGLAATPLRDQDGRRIGTFMSNKILQSEASIAQHLNVRAASFDGERMSMSDFFRGVAGMKTPEAVRNALSVGTDSAGGYTVPTVLLPGILNALVPASSMLNAGASIAMLTEGAKSYRIAAIDTIPTAGWRNEAGAVAESDATFRAIDIVPRSLAFMFKVSRELLADSPNIDVALNMAIAAAFAKELDRAGLRGTGTAPEVRGLLNTANVTSVAFGGANGGTPTNYSSFITAWKSITTANAPAPKAAIMHPRDMATFANLADTTGQPLQRPPLLEPLQLFQTSQIPTNLTVGTSTDCSEIYVGDFSQFVFYMRESISIQLAPELYAATGQVGFFCHARVDVAAMYAQAFAVIKGIRP